MSNTLRTFLAAAFAAGAFPAVALAATPPAPQHLRGTISTVTATSLTIATATGPVSLALAPDLKVAGVVPATASAIVPGTFIGTANVPGAGAARALEVVVFPDAMRGTGEGDYAWDLPAGGRHSAMTNGTVAKPKTTSMTNATVKHVDDGATRTISVAYKGGTKKIAIPPDAPIVRLEPGTRALLVTGAHVFVVASPGAKPVAMRVLAGERGTVPPM